MNTLIEKYFFWLIIYSIAGWIYESILCSITERRLINRGFLNGPYCPIYGSGAVLVVIFLGKVSNPLLIFMIGVLLTCSLEYLTSFLMEKVFHARWWDYSDRKFNINGRVCLIGAVIFGAFSVLLIEYIHPYVVQFTNQIPLLTFHIVTALLFLIFMTDSAITISGFTSFNLKLKDLTATLDQSNEHIADKIMNTSDSITGMYERIRAYFNKQQWRMILSFPKLKSIRYDHNLTHLKNFIARKRKKH